jgi:hypothetical protein
MIDQFYVTRHMRSQVFAAIVLSVAIAADARAQPGPGGAAQTTTPGAAWSLRASAAAYALPDDDDYIQPTVAADHGALHLEGRYNYEDRRSVSGFVGWNLQFGNTVTFALTPMFGAVAGDTNGIIPGVELDLAWRRLELSFEGEYVIDTDSRSDRFLYSWSEGSLWITDSLRTGVVTQRTRVYKTPRDIQRGLLVGATLSKLELAVYLFNPGSDDHFLVASIGVTF